MLKKLRNAGLITRGKRRNHTYWYRLTELGGLVLLYIPPDRDGEKLKNASPDRDGEKLKKRGRPRKTPALAAQST